MIEAVGARLSGDLFRPGRALLKPDGLALIQAITIEDHRYRQALRAVDFIKRHVFPGSFIPSIAAMLAAKTRASDLGAGGAGGFRTVLRAHARRLAAAILGRDSRRCGRWALMSGSSASGTSISPTAKAVFASARSVWRICCWPSRVIARECHGDCCWQSGWPRRS